MMLHHVCYGPGLHPGLDPESPPQPASPDRTCFAYIRRHLKIVLRQQNKRFYPCKKGGLDSSMSHTCLMLSLTISQSHISLSEPHTCSHPLTQF